jgi:hypothetical protein
MAKILATLENFNVHLQMSPKLLADVHVYCIPLHYIPILTYYISSCILGIFYDFEGFWT